MSKSIYILILSITLVFSCSSSDDARNDNDLGVVDNGPDGSINILSLGDSYTIGQSVCETCRFPEQLKDTLELFLSGSDFELKIIAQTGWTTTALINNIIDENLSNNYDLVTLLIGVNNQYQGQPFAVYETEFPQLVNFATQKARGESGNVIVISIPDYAYTPFGQNSGDPTLTSTEIDMYNAFAEDYCNQNNITFVNITDITREGLDNPDLVASDGLHPSRLAYAKFVERIFPLTLEKIQ